MVVPPLPGLGALSDYVDLASFLGAVMAAYDRFGYLLVFVGAWMEHSLLLGIVIPGGTLVGLGGAAARLGSLDLPLTIATGGLGMLVGAATDYWLGRLGISRALLRSRFGPRLKPGLDRAFDLLQRHGWWAITLVHAMGAGRSAMAVTAGACRMGFWRFMLCEVPAAIIWSTIFNLVGYGVATNLDTIQRILQRAGVAIALLVILALVLRWGWRRRVYASGQAH